MLGREPAHFSTSAIGGIVSSGAAHPRHEEPRPAVPAEPNEDGRFPAPPPLGDCQETVRRFSWMKSRTRGWMLCRQREPLKTP